MGRLFDEWKQKVHLIKEKLNKNWNTVLADTLDRRNITKIYGKNVNEIESLQHFIIKKQIFFIKLNTIALIKNTCFDIFLISIFHIDIL